MQLRDARKEPCGCLSVVPGVPLYDLACHYARECLTLSIGPVPYDMIEHLRRQYDFRAMRLTSGAQRGLASRGQSRLVLSAHDERGGQP